MSELVVELVVCEPLRAICCLRRLGCEHDGSAVFNPVWKVAVQKHGSQNIGVPAVARAYLARGTGGLLHDDVPNEVAKLAARRGWKWPACDRRRYTGPFDSRPAADRQRLVRDRSNAGRRRDPAGRGTRGTGKVSGGGGYGYFFFQVEATHRSRARWRHQTIFRGPPSCRASTDRADRAAGSRTLSSRARGPIRVGRPHAQAPPPAVDRCRA